MNRPKFMRTNFSKSTGVCSTKDDENHSEIEILRDLKKNGEPRKPNSHITTLDKFHNYKKL